MVLIYLLAEAAIGVIAGILIAACSKKKEDRVISRLDKAGRITNVLLLLVYVCLAPVYMAFGIFSYPNHGGLLGILGWIVTIFNNSTALLCCLSLGFSVALRKKGESKKSFLVQFGGIVAIILTLAFYIIFEGSLLMPLN